MSLLIIRAMDLCYRIPSAAFLHRSGYVPPTAKYSDDDTVGSGRFFALSCPAANLFDPWMNPIKRVSLERALTGFTSVTGSNLNSPSV